MAPESKYAFTTTGKRSREIFEMEENLLFCDNLKGLITATGMFYVPSEWRPCIDKSKISLKCGLFHIGNKLNAVAIGRSLQIKKAYENIKTILDRIKYTVHE